MDVHDKGLLQIRKLRKKIRQIEHLERLERDLTDEEIYKCMKKDSLRESLQELLSEFSDLDSLPYSSFKDADFSLPSTVSTDFSTCLSPSASEATVDTEDAQTEVVRPDDVVIGQGDVNVELSDGAHNETTDNFEAQPSEIPWKVQTSSNSRTVSSVLPQTTTKSDGDKQAKKKTEQTSQKQDDSQKIPKKKANKGNSLEERWQMSGFKVTMLESHNDLVTAVDCCGPLIVSASRDTTVKVWDQETLDEIRSLGSHTGSVTDVVILAAQALGQLAETLGVSSSDHVILSGSTDCSLKVWGVDNGQLLQSIYTYNPITKVAFSATLCLAITSSDGGKLELWDLDTKECVSSVNAHTDAVTGLCVQGNHIFTSCAVNGEIKVYEIRNRVLHCIYVSENIHTSSGSELHMRPVRSLAVKGDNLYYGDDGVNLKILSWKKGIARKLTNHKEEFGMTDVICIRDNMMLTSAYDLDNGQGYVNVFDLSENPRYLGTLDTGESGRILDVCSTTGPNNLITMVTAGIELQVWQQVAVASKDEDSIPVSVEPKIRQPAVDSDMESEVEFTDSEEEDAGGRQSRRGSVQSQTRSGWGSWCSIV